GALRAALRGLERRLGRSVCGRTALPAEPRLARAAARLGRAPPPRASRARARGCPARPPRASMPSARWRRTPRKGCISRSRMAASCSGASPAPSPCCASTPRRAAPPRCAGACARPGLCSRAPPASFAAPRRPSTLAWEKGFSGGPMDGRRILLAVAGGLDAYKVAELVRGLRRAGHRVRCALTREAAHFVAPLTLQTVSGEAVRSELFDATQEGEIDHIALADWAEAVVVAPATANLLAKMAAGLADDLVSTLLLAPRAPMLVAPAMNVNMWRHAATQSNVAVLRE